MPQAPQLSPSVRKLVQKAEAPLPQAFGVAAGQEQAPSTQAWPALQVVPASLPVQLEDAPQ